MNRNLWTLAAVVLGFGGPFLAFTFLPVPPAIALSAVALIAAAYCVRRGARRD